ncbi:hypothetical protein JCM11641_007284 [Rhodosporidiobolus odoratus]
MSFSSTSLRHVAAFLLGIVGLNSAFVNAHEHHQEDVGPYEQNFLNEELIDRALWFHIGIQILCWGILFPAGMVLGITRSRFHVPLQTLTIVLSLVGNSLGHHHGGRSFHMTAHAHFAGYLWWYMISQAVCGVFLRMHVMEGTFVRRSVVAVHGIIGKSFPLVGWVQMLFGGIAANGFCFGEHFGQCLAHFIMGSGFIAYAAILLLMLRVGAGWLARRNVSQEFLDSWVIMLWGIVNTLTMHNFLKPGQSSWTHKDLQHTMLGVLWWAGGALGIFLGRNGKRNVLPALVIGMTGYAMGLHGQALEFSTRVHQLFGGALMAAGAARVIEICFVLRDAPTPPVTDTTGPSSFQHLTPFLLVLSGLTFLSATEEQMQWVAGSPMDSTTYSLVLFSGSFAIYLVGVSLVDLYERQIRSKTTAQAIGVERVEDLEGNGLVRLNTPERPQKLFGIPLPGALVKLVDFARRLEDGGNASRGHGRDRGHLRSETADYEAMPLTSSRESADVRSDSMEMEMRREAERGRQDGTGQGTAASDETVFELGEEDDGQDESYRDLFYADALALARELDEIVKTTGKTVGPFHGVPISIKDHFDIAGTELTMGYVSYLGRISERDSALVALLRDAGAIFYVRTNVPQTLMKGETDNQLFGRTRNPYNTDLIPGWSSGGEVLRWLTASACRSHLCRAPTSGAPSGSLRQSAGSAPSALLPAYGHGTISLLGQEFVLSVAAPMARSLSSCTQLPKAVFNANPANYDATFLPFPFRKNSFTEVAGRKKLAFGVMRTDHNVTPTTPIARALEMTVEKLVKAGHEPIEFDMKDFKDAFALSIAFFVADGGEDFRQTRTTIDEPLIEGVSIEPNSQKTVHELWGVNRLKDAYQQNFLAKWLKRMFNLLDVPAIVLPVTKVDPAVDKPNSNFKPVSEMDQAYQDAFQLVGRRWADEELLGIGEMVAKILGV